MKRWLSLLVGLAIILLCFRTLNVSLDEFLDRIKQMRLDYLLLVTLLALTNMGLIAHRWSLIVCSSLDKTLFPRGFFLLVSILSSFSGFFLPNTIGSVGIKSMSLKKVANTSWETALMLIILDQGLNFFIVACMLPPCLVLFLDLTPRALYLSGTIVFMTFLLWGLWHFRATLFTFMLRFGRLVHHRIGQLSKRVADIIIHKKTADFMMAFIESKDFKVITFYSLLYYSMGVTRYYCIAQALGIDLNFFVFFFSFPVIYFIQFFAPTPSGLGFQEVGWVAVMMFHGIDHSLAISFAISCQVIEKFLLLLMSLCGYIYTQKYGPSLSLFWSSEASVNHDAH